MDILPEAGALIACNDVERGDIADDAIDAAIRGNKGFDICQQVNQSFGTVGGIVTALPVLVEFGGFEQLGGVEFEAYSNSLRAAAKVELYKDRL